MQLPERIDLDFLEGDTFLHTFAYVDGNGTPIDVSGYAAQMDIRDETSDPTPLFVIATSGGPTGGTIGDGLITVQGVPGKFTCRIEKSVTVLAATLLNFEKAKWVYDLRIFEPDAPETKAIRLAEGKITAKPAVTRQT